MDACNGVGVVTFKDDLKRDLDRVFFNPTELSSFHRLNDIVLQCVTRRISVALSSRVSEQYDGLHGDQLIVQCRAADIQSKVEELPKENERVKFDGQWYDVISCENEYGSIRLTLASYRGAYA